MSDVIPAFYVLRVWLPLVRSVSIVAEFIYVRGSHSVHIHMGSTHSDIVEVKTIH